MAQFRKKPVVIEAVVWHRPGDERDIGAPILTMTSRGGRPYIDTLEGPMFISPGDWIIRGVKGEFYPCKPDVFAATYEAVIFADPGDAGAAMARLAHGLDACIVRRTGPLDVSGLAA